MARPLAGPASPPSLSVSSRRPPAPRGLVPGGPRAEGGAGPEGGCDGPGGWSWWFGVYPGAGGWTGTALNWLERGPRRRRSC